MAFRQLRAPALLAAAAMLFSLVLVTPATAGKATKQISFAPTYTVTEGQGVWPGDPEYAYEDVQIPVSRSSKQKTASVTVTASSGGANPATSGVDYSLAEADRTVTFARNRTTAWVTIRLWADWVPDEPDETFVLTLSDPSTGWVIDQARTSMTVTIKEMPVPAAPVVRPELDPDYPCSSVSVYVDAGTSEFPVTWDLWRSTDNATWGDPIPNASAAASVYYDHDLIPGTTYWYRSIAYNAEGVASPESAPASVTIPDWSAC